MRVYYSSSTWSGDVDATEWFENTTLQMYRKPSIDERFELNRKVRLESQ